MTALPEVTVQRQDFDVAELQRELLRDSGAVGAVVSFTGLVRGSNQQGSISCMELEHYPGMTEQSIQQIIQQARERWHVLAARVVHRIGKLQPGDNIVYVGVSSAHRGDAFQACEFIMDYLKTSAPFWKKESGADGSHWVTARDSDASAAERWKTLGTSD